VPGAGDRPGAGGAPGPAGATGLSRLAATKVWGALHANSHSVLVPEGGGQRSPGAPGAAHSYGTAAPSDVAKAVGAMANTIEELGSGYLAGLDSTLVRLRQQLNSEIAERDRLCT
jgi:hypothetical protein